MNSRPRRCQCRWVWLWGIVVFWIAAAVRAPLMPGSGHLDLSILATWAGWMKWYPIGEVFGDPKARPAAERLRSPTGEKAPTGRHQYLLIDTGAPGQLLASAADYPVGSMSILWLVGCVIEPWLWGPEVNPRRAWFQVDEESPATRRVRTVMKAPAAFFDALAAALLGVWIGSRFGSRSGLWIGTLYAIHPAVIFNSAIWGQVDAWHGLAMLVCIIAMACDRIMLGCLAFTLGILCKLQVLALSPVVGACLIRWAVRDDEARLPIGSRTWNRTWRLGKPLALGLAWFALIHIPWLLAGAGTKSLRHYQVSIGRFPYATMQAFNFHWIVDRVRGAPPGEYDKGLRDRIVLLHLPGLPFGITHRTLFVTIVLLLWGRIAWSVGRGARDNAQGVLDAGWLSVLVFFCLAPEMHERYLLPVVALQMAAYQPTKRWWLGLGVLGGAAFANPAAFFAGPPGSWIESALRGLGPLAGGLGVIVALMLLLIALDGLWRLVSPRHGIG